MVVGRPVRVKNENPFRENPEYRRIVISETEFLVRFIRNNFNTVNNFNDVRGVHFIRPTVLRVTVLL